MLSHFNPNLDTETVCQKLASNKEQLQSEHLRELFAADPERFNRYSIQFEQLLFDYRKNRINQDLRQGLNEWNHAQNLTPQMGVVFSHQQSNYTVHRAALPWELHLPKQNQQLAEL